MGASYSRVCQLMFNPNIELYSKVVFPKHWNLLVQLWIQIFRLSVNSCSWILWAIIWWSLHGQHKALLIKSAQHLGTWTHTDILRKKCSYWPQSFNFSVLFFVNCTAIKLWNENSLTQMWVNATFQRVRVTINCEVVS